MYISEVRGIVPPSLRYIDILAVAYLYINILIPKITFLSLPINKIVFGFLIIAFVYRYVKGGVFFPVRSAFYIYFATVSMVILGIVGLALGNDAAEVADFVSFLPILLCIPIFVNLFIRYGIEKYVFHVQAATSILALGIVCVYLYFKQFPGWNEAAYTVNDALMFATQVTYHGPEPQVAVVMAGWLPLAFFLTYAKLIKQRSMAGLLQIAVVLFALFASMSAGLWLCLPFSLILYGIMNRQHRKIIFFSGLMAMIVGLMSLPLIPDGILDIRLQSIAQKSQQSLEALDIFLSHPFLGLGLGHVYTNQEISAITGDKSAIFEATYPMILSSTGFLGVLLYSFIFLFYPLVYMCSDFKSDKTKHLFICYNIILFEAIGNPYLWGGGLGILVMSLMAASLELDTMNNRRLAE